MGNLGQQDLVTLLHKQKTVDILDDNGEDACNNVQDTSHYLLVVQGLTILRKTSFSGVNHLIDFDKHVINE